MARRDEEDEHTRYASADHGLHTPDAAPTFPPRSGSSEGVFEQLHHRPAADEGDARDVEADRLRPRPGGLEERLASERSLAASAR